MPAAAHALSQFSITKLLEITLCPLPHLHAQNGQCHSDQKIRCHPSLRAQEPTVPPSVNRNETHFTFMADTLIQVSN